MQGDNLPDVSYLISWRKIRKNISKCDLLTFLPVNSAGQDYPPYSLASDLSLHFLLRLRANMITKLTLKALSKICSRQHSNFCLSYYFSVKTSLDILCESSDDYHKKKKDCHWLQL